jgi:two-component system, NarL family, sensor histidine kinase DesK
MATSVTRIVTTATAAAVQPRKTISADAITSPWARAQLQPNHKIQSLAGVARGALHDMQALTRDQHTVTLAAEIDGAASLLAAAGVHLRLDVDLPELPAAAEEVLAWAVKEGATNIMRHSQASTCAIAARRRRGRVQLEIVNDGAGTPVGEGSGLAGLAARAHAVDGTASAGPVGDGRFRLLVELPQAYP